MIQRWRSGTAGWRGSLDERARRVVVAAEALALGRGGITAVARATGLARKPIARGMGEVRGERPVADLLHDLQYRLQGNRKTREGDSHPDRDAQFAHINATAEAFVAAGDPVLSVDTKKKELVGDCKNGGREWRPKGEPEAVRMHDFALPELGKHPEDSLCQALR